MSALFHFDGKPMPDNGKVPHAFAFCVLMAACVAKRRGGRNIQWVRECFDFMREVVSPFPLTLFGPLPEDFDWRRASAVECADAMMEYEG